MFIIRVKKQAILILGIFLVFGFSSILFLSREICNAEENKNFIKYAEFNPTYEALNKAMKEDIKSHDKDIKINWIEVLACLGSKYGGDFKRYKESDMDEILKKLKSGKPMSEITSGMKNYNYYYQVYEAVLKEFLGTYKIKKNPSNGDEEWQEIYGLKAFSPIAKTFPFSHFDDFGASRSYGFSRPHLGHDMMSATGTPVVAVESGTVEIMGWNQYGGWRIGIRSFDKKRYYYYAHLRQNKPYSSNLKEGAVVKAGDVIGYVGRTGYSTKENVNNINESHLHWGMELIFDESQKECDNEIWINLYAITKLLEQNKCSVMRNTESREFSRECDFWEANLENK